MAKKIQAYIKLQVNGWSGSGSARRKYHGILQGVQRQDSGHGTWSADSGDHYCLQ